MLRLIPTGCIDQADMAYPRAWDTVLRPGREVVLFGFVIVGISVCTTFTVYADRRIRHSQYGRKLGVVVTPRSRFWSIILSNDWPGGFLPKTPLQYQISLISPINGHPERLPSYSYSRPIRTTICRGLYRLIPK